MDKRFVRHRSVVKEREEKSDAKVIRLRRGSAASVIGPEQSSTIEIQNESTELI